MYLAIRDIYVYNCEYQQEIYVYNCMYSPIRDICILLYVLTNKRYMYMIVCTHQ